MITFIQIFSRKLKRKYNDELIPLDDALIITWTKLLDNMAPQTDSFSCFGFGYSDPHSSSRLALLDIINALTALLFIITKNAVSQISSRRVLRLTPPFHHLQQFNFLQISSNSSRRKVPFFRFYHLDKSWYNSSGTCFCGLSSKLLLV